mgnify:CR=1 FL=1
MSSYFNTKHSLIAEIEEALDAVEFGSVEIYVTDKKVTQITVRNIKKTSIDITEPQEISQTKRQPKTFTIRANFRKTE